MAATNDSERPKPSSPLTSPKNDKIIDKKAAKQARKKANRKNKKGAAGTNDSLTIEVAAVSETESTISPRTSPRLAALREKEEAAQEILVALEDKQEAAQEIVNELERKIKRARRLCNKPDLVHHADRRCCIAISSILHVP